MPIDEDKLLEPEIVEFLACLSTNSMNNDRIYEDLHGMIARSQERQDYIESWIKTIMESHDSILQYLMTLFKSR